MAVVGWVPAVAGPLIFVSDVDDGRAWWYLGLRGQLDASGAESAGAFSCGVGGAVAPGLLVLPRTGAGILVPLLLGGAAAWALVG